ncbi:MAG: 30S ribosomal protein S18 [Polyangiales bacterium]
MSYSSAYKDDDLKNGRGGPGGGGGPAGENDPFGLRRRTGKRKVCRFCADAALLIDYKDANLLKYFISDRGKIVPRRISGNCALHQRAVTTAIKRARNIALMPYTSGG